MDNNEQPLKEWAMEGGHLNLMKHMSQLNDINRLRSAILIAVGLIELKKCLMNMPRPNRPQGGQMFKSTNN